MLYLTFPGINDNVSITEQSEPAHAVDDSVSLHTALDNNLELMVKLSINDEPAVPLLSVPSVRIQV